MDVSWENIIALQLNKYITVNLNTHLIYDADILFDTDNDGIPDKTKVQFKEILVLDLWLSSKEKHKSCQYGIVLPANANVTYISFFIENAVVFATAFLLQKERRETIK